MIDDEKRQERKRQKEKVRRRMRVEIDPNNYEFIPAKKPIESQFTSASRPMTSARQPPMSSRRSITRIS